ncbi:MAG: hypothetical protein RLO81_12450 [Fulvivirga sp.]|uniref:hypothetical protein n=1 Tax=Fulvivirga sp. TaxID=1931237 RepID=UPI0032EB278D
MRILKITIGLLLIIAFTIALSIFLLSEELPKGTQGPRAEELADKMLEALNKPAWDSIKVVSWSYPRGHDYVWDKENKSVAVKWDDYLVVINTDTEKGEVFEAGKKVNDDDLFNTGLKYFYNDSFWLIAPFKVKDPGTIRSIVNYDGSDALLVQYTSGGVTPGDSYLWILDKEHKPKAWKFWTSLVPIGGMEFTWENWVSLHGAKISTFHEGLIDIKITNLK